jgi:hypothetical protein
MFSTCFIALPLLEKDCKMAHQSWMPTINLQLCLFTLWPNAGRPAFSRPDVSRPAVSRSTTSTTRFFPLVADRLSSSFQAVVSIQSFQVLTWTMALTCARPKQGCYGTQIKAKNRRTSTKLLIRPASWLNAMPLNVLSTSHWRHNRWTIPGRPAYGVELVCSSWYISNFLFSWAVVSSLYCLHNI